MASLINADDGVVSGSAGVKTTADSSGVLALQTNGTTALSISTAQVVSFTNSPTYTAGTANGVAYLNASKVLTTGSALYFDGTSLGIGSTSPVNPLTVTSDTSAQVRIGTVSANINARITLAASGTGINVLGSNGTAALAFYSAATEHARFDTSGNFGIGTSSPAYKLDVVGGQRINAVSGGYLDLSYNGTVVGNILAGNALFYVNTQTTNTTINANGGNVGIGTTSPAYKLDVNGVANFAANVGHRVGAALFFAGTGTSSGLNYLYTNTTAMVWRNAADSSELMRLDNSGNLLVGGTSLTASEKISVQTNANSAQYIWVRNSSSGASASSAIALNAYGNTWGIECGSSAKNSNSLTFVLDYSGTFVEKMRLDTSGNLGLGVTPSAWGTFTGVLEQTYGSFIAAYSNQTNYGLNAYFNGTNWIYKNSVASTRYNQSSGAHQWYNAASGTAGNAITFTQAMTLAATGNLLVGTTSDIINSNARATFVGSEGLRAQATIGSGSACIGAFATSTGGTYYYIGYDLTASAVKFQVLFNGNVQNTNNSYGAISDVKLKENIVDASPKLVDLMQVKVRNYNLKNDPSHKQLGVIAQELEQVFPAMIEEAPDRDAKGNDLGTTTKSVKYSVFVPMLIKAMQEQQALIESLTARLNSLENK